jgi:hypothetical protein
MVPLEAFLLWSLPFSILPIIYGLVAFRWAQRHSSAKLSRGRAIVAMMPSLLMVGLFYWLSFQMHRDLGRWPDMTVAWMGPESLSPPVLTLKAVAWDSFVVWMAFSQMAVPLLLVAFMLVRGLKPLVAYLGLHSFAFVVCLVAVNFAPARLLYWYWN